MACASANAVAQRGTNSPYSRYGLGELSSSAQGYSKGMGGAGIGVRQGNIVNTQNPASYSSIDSLTMIFDVGLTGSFTHFTEDGRGANSKSACFDYLVGSFRLLPHLGASFGLTPFSDVGYKYTTKDFLDSTNGTITSTYSGEGGLRQVFIGLGWNPFGGFSVGANVAYLWGDIENSSTSSSTTYINSLSRLYTASVNSYKLDFGLQQVLRLQRDETLTLGATVGIGHKLGADAKCLVVETNTVSSARDTTSYVVENGLSLPLTVGVGAAWTKQNRLTVAADYTLQKWGALQFPAIGTTGYALSDDQLCDLHRAALGADFVPSAFSRSYYQRVHYKLGASYTTPYYKIKGNDGPKRFSLSAGLGLPLQNAYNNRSVLNVSLEWSRSSAKDLITDNSIRLSVGLTFNERWFQKWKVE